MYAVEFETRIAGGVVKIPANFRKLQSAEKAKVVILVEEDDVAEKPLGVGFIERMATNPIRLEEGSQFLSREEANER